MKRLIYILKQIALAPFALLCLLFCAVGALFYAVVYIVDGGERRADARAAKAAARAACLFLFAVALLGAGGCVNAFTVRNPFSDAKVERIYQSTSAAACASIIVAFPQMMSDAPSMHGFDPLNIVTVPLGCLVLVDTVCEAAIDTVCLPYDIPVSIARANAERRWREKERERMRQSVTQSGTTHDGTEK